MAAGLLATLQLTLVVLWAVVGPKSRVRSVSLAAACVSCASSLMSCVLSYAEHARSLRPSSLLNVFLFVSVVLDMALLRTLWLAPQVVAASIQGVFTAAFAAKVVLLVLEARGKAAPGRGPEETASLYARAVFAWVTPLLATGFRKLLQPADLFSLDEHMRTAALGHVFWVNWEHGEHLPLPRTPSPDVEFPVLEMCTYTPL